MTDKELIEMAAKAAGITGTWHRSGYVAYSGWSGSIFDPLNDDGDALRLAAKLHMTICTDGDLFVSAGFLFTNGPLVTQCIEESGCKESATRRAITRAAAQICKEME